MPTLAAATHPVDELPHGPKAREWGDVGEENQDPGDGEGS